jgi:hypothetical protein
MVLPDFDKDITAGELIDLDKYLELKDYSRLLSILYRPIIKERGLYQIEHESTYQILQVSYNISMFYLFFVFISKLVQVT